MYDLTDYTAFLDAERDELMDAALEQDRAAIAANSDDIILEMEVMLMMEMV